MTPEIILAAVTQTRLALKYVNQEDTTPSLGLLLLINNIEISNYFSEDTLQEIEELINNPKSAFKHAIDTKNYLLIDHYLDSLPIEILMEEAYLERSDKELQLYLQEFERVVIYDSDNCGPIYQENVRKGIREDFPEFTDEEVEEAVLSAVEHCLSI